MKEEIELTGDGAKLERQEHSPLPWQCDGTTVFFRNAEHDNEPAIAECGPSDDSTAWIDRESLDPAAVQEANARFIVRAVNNHGALLEQLRESALAVHTIGAYHNPLWITFERCDKPLCVSARKVLSAVDSQ